MLPSKIHTKESKTTNINTAAVSRWVSALALQAEGWVFESQPHNDLSGKNR